MNQEEKEKNIKVLNLILAFVNYLELDRKIGLRIAKGDKKMKKEILSALGQNLSLKDGKLTIQLKEPFKIIANTLSSVPEAKRRLEPVKIGANKGKTPAFADVNPTWLRG